MKGHPPMLLLGVIVVVVASLGAAGCTSDPPPTVPAATKTAAVQKAPTPPASASPAASAPRAVHPLSGGWARSSTPEPDPIARGLYRRTIDRAGAGALAEVTTLSKRIRAEHADSRFAHRLRPGGDAAATAAMLGLAATVALTLGVGDALPAPTQAAPTP